MTNEQSHLLHMIEKHKALEVCNRWELTASETGALLGVVMAGNNAQFDQNGAMNIDDYSAERLTYCVLIEQGLVSLFNDPNQRHRWLYPCIWLSKSDGICITKPESF